MGGGGCKTALEDGVTPSTEERETSVNNFKHIPGALEIEREEKVKAQPKFYWAHDEEPHRRR